MSDLAFHALPVEEKKQLAIQLRPSLTIRELAEVLGIGTKRAFNWTRHLKVDRRQRRKSQVSAERCECSEPIGDARFDNYCKRTQTCFCCGKRVA